ncbi:hypothetical protein, partial [Burkholderia ubonensis]
ARSSDFGLANAFSDAAERLDAPLSSLATPEQAFKLIVAVLEAADWNAFSAKALVQSRFAGMLGLREKAIEYIAQNPSLADAYLASVSVAGGTTTGFVAKYLTNETVA